MSPVKQLPQGFLVNVGDVEKIVESLLYILGDEIPTISIAFGDPKQNERWSATCACRRRTNTHLLSSWGSSSSLPAKQASTSSQVGHTNSSMTADGDA
jgi:hypothetical protein